MDHSTPDDISELGAHEGLIYLTTAFLSVLLFTAFLIFIGLSFGIRRAYVHILLKLFEYITSKANDSSQSSRGKVENVDQHRQTKHNLIEHNTPLSQEGLLNFYNDFEENVGENKELLASLGAFYYVKAGLEAIVDDQVTQRFSAENLQTWNLLTRTNTYQHINLKLTFLWGVGFCLRYFLLLPFRGCLALSAIGGLMIGTSITRHISDKRKRDSWNARLLIFFFRLFMRSFSSVITFHNSENCAKSDGICVANHTSPIDAIVLSCDRSYAMVGQRQGGFMGFMQSVFGSAESHVWFDRSEVRDRMAVARRMQTHVEDPEKNPILIFPEGTCINNTSVMMFKKGSFEIGGVIYPVAIKYDTRFADCFWNSSKEGFVRHLMRMMTSWAIVADVWYLPPMHQEEGETAIAFAQRVKHCIARQGGLVDLEWDGNLKRSAPKPDLKLKQRKYFSDKILENEEFNEKRQEEQEEDTTQEDDASVVRHRNPVEVEADEVKEENLHNSKVRLNPIVSELAGDVVA